MRDRARQGFDFFLSRGYSPQAAGGILGNFVGESGLNPGARNPGDGSDGSDSIGLGQWNGQRAVNLRRFALANKLNPGDFDTQLKFTDWELRNTHRSAYDGLMAAKTPTEAAAAFVTRFERPKGSDRGAEYSHGWGTRNAHANAIFGAFGNGRSSGGGSDAVEVLDAPTARPAPAAAMVELLDDAADMPAPNARETGFMVPPAPGSGEMPVMVGQPAPSVELLPDEPTQRLRLPRRPASRRRGVAFASRCRPLISLTRSGPLASPSTSGRLVRLVLRRARRSPQSMSRAAASRAPCRSWTISRRPGATSRAGRTATKMPWTASAPSTAWTTPTAP